MPHRIVSVCLCLLLCLPGVLAAAAIEPVAAIRAAALSLLETEARANAEITLDANLRMPQCGKPLQARYSGAGTVEVSCPGGWRLYVPMRLRRQAQVLVLTRAIAAGQRISADMLVRESRDTTRLIGAPLSDPDQATGQLARRALPAGSVLVASHLRAPDLIDRGDPVILVSRQHGIEVRMAARALTAAAAGERISAENLSSKRRVQGVVMDDGEVRVLQ